MGDYRLSSFNDISRPFTASEMGRFWAKLIEVLDADETYDRICDIIEVNLAEHTEYCAEFMKVFENLTNNTFEADAEAYMEDNSRHKRIRR